MYLTIGMLLYGRGSMSQCISTLMLPSQKLSYEEISEATGQFKSMIQTPLIKGHCTCRIYTEYEKHTFVCTRYKRSTVTQFAHASPKLGKKQ